MRQPMGEQEYHRPAKTLAGAMSGGQPLASTGYLGFDAAGVVDEVGEGVTGVSVGEDVLGRGSNTQAEAGFGTGCLSMGGSNPALPGLCVSHVL